MSRILVVDDEHLIRWSLSHRLEQDGHRVLLADSAAGALDQLSDDIDLVLLDLKLPDVDDLSLLGKIKGQLPDCPVILMTAHGDPDLFREARLGGAFRTLEKPFGLDSLVDLVGEALDTRT